MMEVHVHDTDSGVVLIAPEGDIDGKTAPDFEDQVVRRIETDGRMVINLSHVGFMSSAGLRAMLLVYKQAAARHEKLALAGVNPDILKSMSATGFLSFFDVCDSEEAALEKVSGHATH